jgi:hypothetical protein
MDPARVDFQQLRIKHILFKSKVRSVLYGGTYDETFFSRTGPLNTWFKTVGLMKYRGLVEMLELTQVQQELNHTADLLFGLYKSGQIDQAHEGLGGLENRSEKFLQLLSRLEEKATL